MHDTSSPRPVLAPLPMGEHEPCRTGRFESGAGVGCWVGVGVGVGVGCWVGVGVGLATTTLTPLLHTSFLPLFMHVNLYPPTVVVEINFVHVEPALTTAKAEIGAHKIKDRDTTTTERFTS